MSSRCSLFLFVLIVTIVLPIVKAQADVNELTIDEPVSEFGNILEVDPGGNSTFTLDELQLPSNSSHVESTALNSTSTDQQPLVDNSSGSDQAQNSSATNSTKFENIIGWVELPLISDLNNIDGNTTEGLEGFLPPPSLSLNGTEIGPVLGENSTGVEASPSDAELSANGTNVLQTVEIQALIQKLDPKAPLVNSMLTHSKLLTQLMNLTVESNGEKWSFMDICHRLPPPRATVRTEGVFAEIIANIFDAISPCVVMSPLDCFWEGGKALGPFPPYEPGLAARALFPSLQSLDDGEGIAWTKMNALHLGGDFENMGSIFANVSTKVLGTFEYAVGDSYPDRPCLDPIDPDCPATAPNKFDMCSAVDQYAAWKEKQGTPVAVDLVKKPAQTIRQKLLSFCTVESSDTIRCKQLAQEVRTFIEEHRDGGIEFLNSTTSLPLPPLEAFSKLTSDGCHGVLSKLMIWPKAVLVDETKDAEGKSVVQRLRTVIPLNTAEKLFNRYKENHSTKPALEASKWSVETAQQVIDAWKSAATKTLSDGATLETEQSDGSESFPAAAIEQVGPALQKVQNFYDSLEKLEKEENL